MSLLPRVARIFEAVGGLLLVVLIMSDVFRTVLVPRATHQALRVGPLLGSMLLWAVRPIVRNMPALSRYKVLSLLGPILMVASTMTWFLLLILGLSLLMHAARSGFAPEVDLPEALYVAASSFLTLGVTGHDVRSSWVHGLIVGAGLSGFGLVPLAITFLLNVQGALMQREQMVLRLGERGSAPPTGPAILLRLVSSGERRQGMTERFLEDWDRWFSEVKLTHGAFPALAYFRSSDPRCDWLVALGAVLDAVTLLVALECGPAPELASECHLMGSRLVNQLVATFCDSAGGTGEVIHNRFEQTLEVLHQAGLHFDCGHAHAQRELYEMLRTEYAPQLAALHRHFCIMGTP